MATVSQAAAHIFLAPRNFYDLLDRGVIERQEAGGYDLEIVREEYIRHLQKVAAGREKKSGGLDGEYERARKDKELADQTAMRNSLTRGQLIEADKVTDQIAREYGVVRQRFMGIRGKLADTLEPLQAMRVEDEIIEALDELSTPEKFDALQAAYDKQAKQEKRK